jgi:NADPH-dependent 2,4-dienoyl-CoA reductase/sulfur reductase-like enzyme
VYACGDCAEYVTDAGASVVRQLWSTARRMGRAAGLNAAGHGGTYADTDPGTVVDLFGTVAASVGLQGGALGGAAHVIERQTQAGYSRIILGGGRVVGAQFIGKLDDAWAVQAMRGRAWEPSEMRVPLPGFPAYHWLSRVETRG